MIARGNTKEILVAVLSVVESSELYYIPFCSASNITVRGQLLRETSDLTGCELVQAAVVRVVHIVV